MSEDSMNLTAGETKFLSAVMANLTSDIQFNTEGVAAMLGLKDGTIARARWNTIKRTKLGIISDKTGAGVKKSPAKKDKKGTDGADDGDDAEGGETPVKATPKKRGRKPKADAAEAGSDAEGTPVKATPKKRGRKPKSEEVVDEQQAAKVKEEEAEGDSDTMDGVVGSAEGE